MVSFTASIVPKGIFPFFVNPRFTVLALDNTITLKVINMGESYCIINYHKNPNDCFICMIVFLKEYSNICSGVCSV